MTEDTVTKFKTKFNVLLDGSCIQIIGIESALCVYACPRASASVRVWAALSCIDIVCEYRSVTALTLRDC